MRLSETQRGKIHLNPRVTHPVSGKQETGIQVSTSSGQVTFNDNALH